MSKKECSINKKTSIGGQALIEGIMMRGPKMTAMAVRNPEGEIVLEKWETETTARAKFFKLPIIRGVFGFIDSMRFGYKCLMRSAQISGLDDLEEEAKREKEQKKAEKARKKALKKSGASEDEAVAEQTEETVAQAETVVQTAEAQSEEKTAEEKKSSDALMNVIMAIAMVLGVALSITLFIMLPSFIYKWVSALIPALDPEHPALKSLVK